MVCLLGKQSTLRYQSDRVAHHKSYPCRFHRDKQNLIVIPINTAHFCVEYYRMIMREIDFNSLDTYIGNIKLML